MGTLHNFTSGLEPIREFDDGGLGDNAGGEIVSVQERGYFIGNGLTAGIILAPVIELLCRLYAENSTHRYYKLFHFIKQELKKANMWINLDDAVRLQLQRSIEQLMRSALRTFDADVAVGALSSEQSVVRFQQPVSTLGLTGQPVPSFIECVNESSKLCHEFEYCEPLTGGRGAYGKIFTATKKSDGVKYAIKQIKMKSKDENFKQWQREIESLAQLSHSNIVRYYDSWEGLEFVSPKSGCCDDDDDDDDDESCSQGVEGIALLKDGTGPMILAQFLYIQMELCSETLKSWLLQRIGQEIDYDMAYYIAKQILKGVDYIHSQGWLHRDLKPLNIFLMTNSMNTKPLVKIGDFGLARKTLYESPLVDYNCVKEGFTSKVGTPMYAAPELDGSNYDQKSDMFSVGLILYELYYPFGTDQEKVNDFDKLKKAEINVDFKRNRPLEASIIQQLTASNPQDRPTAAEVLQRLREINNATVDVHRESLKEKKFEVLDLKNQLSEKNNLLVEKDNVIVEKDNLLVKKDSIIERLTCDNKEKDRHILQLTEKIKMLEALLANQEKLQKTVHS